MSTLLEAAKTLIKVLELEKSQIVLSMTSGRALEQLEQAIAQEQPKLKHKMPARGCYTCKHEDERIGVPPCLTCSGKNWEPKP